ncbi:hypothetical protein KIPB_008519, partial [Kipferlia bialata]
STATVSGVDTTTVSGVSTAHGVALEIETVIDGSTERVKENDPTSVLDATPGSLGEVDSKIESGAKVDTGIPDDRTADSDTATPGSVATGDSKSVTEGNGDSGIADDPTTVSNVTATSLSYGDYNIESDTNADSGISVVSITDSDVTTVEVDSNIATEANAASGLTDDPMALEDDDSNSVTDTNDNSVISDAATPILPVVGSSSVADANGDSIAEVVSRIRTGLSAATGMADDITSPFEADTGRVADRDSNSVTEAYAHSGVASHYDAMRSEVGSYNDYSSSSTGAYLDSVSPQESSSLSVTDLESVSAQDSYCLSGTDLEYVSPQPSSSLSGTDLASIAAQDSSSASGTDLESVSPHDSSCPSSTDLDSVSAQDPSSPDDAAVDSVSAQHPSSPLVATEDSVSAVDPSSPSGTDLELVGIGLYALPLPCALLNLLFRRKPRIYHKVYLGHLGWRVGSGHARPWEFRGKRRRWYQYAIFPVAGWVGGDTCHATDIMSPYIYWCLFRALVYSGICWITWTACILLLRLMVAVVCLVWVMAVWTVVLGPVLVRVAGLEFPLDFDSLVWQVSALIFAVGAIWVARRSTRVRVGHDKSASGQSTPAPRVQSDSVSGQTTPVTGLRPDPVTVTDERAASLRTDLDSAPVTNKTTSVSGKRTPATCLRPDTDALSDKTTVSGQTTPPTGQQSESVGVTDKTATTLQTDCGSDDGAACQLVPVSSQTSVSSSDTSVSSVRLDVVGLKAHPSRDLSVPAHDDLAITAELTPLGVCGTPSVSRASVVSSRSNMAPTTLSASGNAHGAGGVSASLSEQTVLDGASQSDSDIHGPLGSCWMPLRTLLTCACLLMLPRGMLCSDTQLPWALNGVSILNDTRVDGTGLHMISTSHVVPSSVILLLGVLIVTLLFVYFATCVSSASNQRVSVEAESRYIQITVTGCGRAPECVEVDPSITVGELLTHIEATGLCMYFSGGLLVPDLVVESVLADNDWVEVRCDLIGGADSDSDPVESDTTDVVKVKVFLPSGTESLGGAITVPIPQYSAATPEKVVAAVQARGFVIPAGCPEVSYVGIGRSGGPSGSCHSLPDVTFISGIADLCQFHDTVIPGVPPWPKAGLVIYGVKAATSASGGGDPTKTDIRQQRQKEILEREMSEKASLNFGSYHSSLRRQSRSSTTPSTDRPHDDEGNYDDQWKERVSLEDGQIVLGDHFSLVEMADLPAKDNLLKDLKEAIAQDVSELKGVDDDKGVKDFWERVLRDNDPTPSSLP